MLRWANQGKDMYTAMYKGVDLVVYKKYIGWQAEGKDGMLPGEVIGHFDRLEQAQAGAERWAKRNYGESQQLLESERVSPRFKRALENELRRLIKQTRLTEYGNLFGGRDDPTEGQQFRAEMKAARREFPQLRAAVNKEDWTQAGRIIKSIAQKIRGWDHRQYGSQNQYIKRRLDLMVNAIAAQDAAKAKGGLDDLEASLHSVF